MVRRRSGESQQENRGKIGENLGYYRNSIDKLSNFIIYRRVETFLDEIPLKKLCQPLGIVFFQRWKRRKWYYKYI
jgi:hypothetical protein